MHFRRSMCCCGPCAHESTQQTGISRRQPEPDYKHVMPLRISPQLSRDIASFASDCHSAFNSITCWLKAGPVGTHLSLNLCVTVHRTTLHRRLRAKLKIHPFRGISLIVRNNTINRNLPQSSNHLAASPSQPTQNIRLPVRDSKNTRTIAPTYIIRISLR
jgi:hypothetical protein